MNIQLPPNNDENFGRQNIHPHVLHQVVRDAAKNRVDDKRNFGIALAAVALGAIVVGYLFQGENLFIESPKTTGGGIPAIVYPDKPKSPIASAPIVAPMPKAAPKTQNERWANEHLPNTDAESKTEGVTIGEYTANKKKIAEMERQLADAKKSAVQPATPQPKKTLSEMEDESEAAIKAEREGKRAAVKPEKEGGVRWGVIMAFLGIAAFVFWLFQSAKNDEKLHDALSFGGGHGH
jgi:hypothetical protein